MSQVGSVLQWNMGCPHVRGAKQPNQSLVLNRCKLIQDAIDVHKPTFVALQEVPEECVRQFRTALVRRYEILRGPIGLVTLYESSNWLLTTANGSVDAGRGILAPLSHHQNNIRIRLWNVHFRSEVRTQRSDKEVLARIFCDVHLRKNRSSVSSDRHTELIVGDFNMDPGDPPMAGKDGFWSNAPLGVVMRADVQARRKPDLQLYRPLFNPMLAVRGRVKGPPGTVYRSGSSGPGPWHTHDQTLMSPAHGLAEEDQIEILEKIGKESLWSNDEIRQPDDRLGSDHFPVLVKFKLT